MAVGFSCQIIVIQIAFQLCSAKENFCFASRMLIGSVKNPRVLILRSRIVGSFELTIKLTNADERISLADALLQLSIQIQGVQKALTGWAILREPLVVTMKHAKIFAMRLSLSD